MYIRNKYVHKNQERNGNTMFLVLNMSLSKKKSDICTYAHTHFFFLLYANFRFLIFHFSSEAHETYLHQWINNTNIWACIKHFVVVSLPVN